MDSCFRQEVKNRRAAAADDGGDDDDSWNQCIITKCAVPVQTFHLRSASPGRPHRASPCADNGATIPQLTQNKGLSLSTSTVGQHTSTSDTAHRPPLAHRGGHAIITGRRSGVYETNTIYDWLRFLCRFTMFNYKNAGGVSYNMLTSGT